MRSRLFHHSIKANLSTTKVKKPSLLFDLADFLILGIFGVVSMRHIIKDCEKRRLALNNSETTNTKESNLDKSDLERAMAIRTAIEKASFNGCEATPSLSSARKHN